MYGTIKIIKISHKKEQCFNSILTEIEVKILEHRL